ncbi:hypothetical protein [Klebsiella grimontii]|uniref:hypothetical protein n=1 Tax=Klebsiella grimontii TaxID=2058152 RepID=UPI0031B6DB3B
MKILFFVTAILFAQPSFAETKTQCEIAYLGNPEKFKVIEHTTRWGYSFYGITCTGCGGIQVEISPASSSDNAYSFTSVEDFKNKISSDYNQKDIAKLEMENISQGGKIKYTILETGMADFFPIKEKINYLYFTAKQDSDSNIHIGYVGFVTSNGARSCTIMASYFGEELSAQGRQSLSYLMNHISL